MGNNSTVDKQGSSKDHDRLGHVICLEKKDPETNEVFNTLEVKKPVES